MKRYSLIFVCGFCLLISQVSFANSRVVERIGDVTQIALPVLAGLFTLLHRDRAGAMQLAQSYLLTIGSVYALKIAVNRKRPNGRHWSFPSGHTASAFAGAAFMERRYGLKYGIPAYLAAGFVGYSRIKTKWHWTTDVLAGAAIAIIANYLLVKSYKVAVVPYVGKDSIGVSASIPL